MMILGPLSRSRRRRRLGSDMSLSSTDRVVEAQHPAGALHDWQIDQLAAEGDRALACGLRLLERVDDAPSVLDLGRARAEDLVEDVDLARMEGRLPREAEASGLDRIAADAFEVEDVGP